MKKIIKICLFLMAFILSFVYIGVKAEDVKDVVTVGFYEYSPYYFLDKDSQPGGYYNDLLELISKELGFDYEYVFLDVEDAINKLEDGEIDLLFGINDTPERAEHFIYTNHYVDIETYILYSNKNIEYGRLDELNGVKFGYIPNEANHKWILSFLKARDIEVEPVYAKTYSEINKLLIDGQVDAIISTGTDDSLEQYNKVFRFSSGPVYIASKKENKELINKINSVFEKYEDTENNPIKKLYTKYFNQYLKQTKRILFISIVLILVILLLTFYIMLKYIIPRFKIKRQRKKVALDLEKENYFLLYQPIIDPKNNIVKGFEALLRLKNGDKVLTPYHFISNIERCDMMFDVSLWILKKVILDYKKIRNFDSVKGRDFYISINLSFREIEDYKFVDKVREMAIKYEIEPNTICLEIVEKFSMNDIKKIQDSIIKLKEYGFMVAIDDFGVEYSNLDILEKIDCNTIKLDKFFIDDIECSRLRKEVVNFVSNLCKFSDKTIVCEGVETKEQRDIIKYIDNDKIYIQGYFYSKPLGLKELSEFKIKKE